MNALKANIRPKDILKRAGYDAINAFEAELAEDGTTLVKLFVHVSQKEQDKRLEARLDDPWWFRLLMATAANRCPPRPPRGWAPCRVTASRVAPPAARQVAPIAQIVGTE